MRAPLTVTVDDGVAPRLLSKRVRSLRFRKTIPGGHADASMSLDVPAATFSDLGPADSLAICEADTGTVLWEGDTSAPGQRSGDAGEGNELSAIGGMGRASDRSERLIYLDASLEKWERDWLLVQARSANISVGQFPEDAGTRAAKAALVAQFTPGQPIGPGSRAGFRYRGFYGSPMSVGGYAGFYDAGQTSADFDLRFFVLTVTQSAAGNYLKAFAGQSGFPVGMVDAVFALVRTGAATNVSTDDVWAALGEVQMLGHLVDRFGTLRDMAVVSHVTSAVGDPPARAHVLAHEVAEDLLGRILTMCDPRISVIEPTTWPIDQLAYHEPATAQTVLDDLGLYESDWLWEINGRAFNWRRWPTTPRYVIGSREELEVPGSDVDLCNRIAVTWQDGEGNQQVTFRYADVPALGGNPSTPGFSGRVRDAESATLPDGRGSLANAERIGDQILASKAKPPRSARAVVTRPIVDLTTGWAVQPWQIEPGYLARVMATGEDLRITETEYVDDDCAATLSLGDPVLTTEQRLARLSAVVS